MIRLTTDTKGTSRDQRSIIVRRSIFVMMTMYNKDDGTFHEDHELCHEEHVASVLKG
jgi:LmbE family N-acetylglucosaminyl deacetylase